MPWKGVYDDLCSSKNGYWYTRLRDRRAKIAILNLRAYPKSVLISATFAIAIYTIGMGT